jgi:5-deoxy-glucuronate isomerase
MGRSAAPGSAPGARAGGPWTLVVTPESAGWGHAGLRVAELAPGESVEFALPADEALVLPLSGACRVECAGEKLELAGRPSPFAGPADVAYLPVGSPVRLSTVDGGRFAVPTARATRRLPVRYVAAADVAVELRGAGACSRQVHNFGTPGELDAEKLIACEVLTPGGNWSSYPPHKHDEERDGELPLEEIYYFEVARDGLAYQRVYGTADRPIDVLEQVRTGDVVLVPHGWHGPSMAAPGYDLYYLNVMAGPSARRAWLIRDDPAHAWVRDTWSGQPVDPRLPMGRRLP